MLRLAWNFLKKIAGRNRRVPGSYSIVSTSRETADILAAFVAHHLTLDVDEIFLFFDEANPAVEAMLAGVPRCRVTVCNDDYWRARNPAGRPEGKVGRQLFNARQARQQTRSEWLIHIDSDEFLLSTGSLKEELARIPPGTNLVQIKNFERFFPEGLVPRQIFDGLFRGGIPRKTAGSGRMFGEATPFLSHGLQGYSTGKTATRCQSPQRLALHPPGSDDGRPDAVFVSASTILLHFDGFTPLHWVTKILRRSTSGIVGTRWRVAQMEFLESATTREQRMSLFGKINILNKVTVKKLKVLDALRDLQFDPLPAMQAQFPGADFDLSPEAFDRRMVTADPDWYQALDLVPDYMRDDEASGPADQATTGT